MFSCFCCFTPSLHVILHQYTESEGTGGGGGGVSYGEANNLFLVSKRCVSTTSSSNLCDMVPKRLLPMFVSVMLEARDVERRNYSNDVHPLLLKTKLLLLHRFFSLSFLADHHKTFNLGLPSFAFFIYSCFLFDPSHLCTYLFISQFI